MGQDPVHIKVQPSTMGLCYFQGGKKIMFNDIFTFKRTGDYVQWFNQIDKKYAREKSSHNQNGSGFITLITMSPEFWKTHKNK